MKRCICNLLALSVVPVLYIVAVAVFGFSVPGISKVSDAVGFWLMIAMIGYILEVLIVTKIVDKENKT